MGVGVIVSAASTPRRFLRCPVLGEGRNFVKLLAEVLKTLLLKEYLREAFLTLQDSDALEHAEQVLF